MASGVSASDDLINHLHVEAEGVALDLVPPAAVDRCKSSTPSPGCVYMRRRRNFGGFILGKDF